MFACAILGYKKAEEDMGKNGRVHERARVRVRACMCTHGFPPSSPLLLLFSHPFQPCNLQAARTCYSPCVDWTTRRSDSCEGSRALCVCVCHCMCCVANLVGVVALCKHEEICLYITVNMFIYYK